jgi:hypothetical protein
MISAAPLFAGSVSSVHAIKINDAARSAVIPKINDLFTKSSLTLPAAQALGFFPLKRGFVQEASLIERACGLLS